MPLLQTGNNLPPPEIFEGRSLTVGTDVDEADWRSMSSGTKQDLPPLDQEMQARIGRFNYVKNPLGHRLLELMRDYVIGGDIGVKIMAKETKVQELINEFWEDPYHDWPRYLPQHVLDLSQDGELVMPASVDQGHVFIGKIDPTIITKVKPDEFFMGKVTAIEVKGQGESKDQHLDVITMDRDAGSTSFRKRTGDVFFWTINRPSGGTRGVSDLFPLSDLIDQLDRFIFARSRNAELRNHYLWDVTLTGASEPQIQKFLEGLIANPPTPGSIRAHNESVAWKSVRPEIEADDASRETEMLMSYILFGFGIPPTASGIIGSGRTALAEQIDILYKTFGSRAREVKNIVNDVINFVLDQAQIANLLDADIDRTFRVIFPRIALRDIQRTGGALSRVGEFFRNMRDLKVYSEGEIRGMMDVFLAALGFDVPDTASKSQKEEKPEKEPEEEPSARI